MQHSPERGVAEIPICAVFDDLVELGRSVLELYPSLELPQHCGIRPTAHPYKVLTFNFA